MGSDDIIAERTATRKMGMLASYWWVKRAGMKSDPAATMQAVKGKRMTARRKFASWKRWTAWPRPPGSLSRTCRTSLIGE